MIYIDGKTWGVPCSVARKAEIKATDISGTMLDGSYFSDILGTYMVYDVTLVVPPEYEFMHTEIYELLTQPVNSHRFILPYNQSRVELDGRVDSLSDTLMYTTTKMQYWRGLKFTVMANHPTKSPDTDDVILRGMSTMPDAYQVPIGTMYMATADGWEVIMLKDSDEIAYPTH